MRQPALMATALPVAFLIVYINFAIITLPVICDDVENKFFFFFFFFLSCSPGGAMIGSQSSHCSVKISWDRAEKKYGTAN